MIRLVRALVYGAMLVPVLTLATPAQARPVLGGQLFSAGGDLHFYVPPSRPDVLPVEFFVSVGGVRRFIATGEYTGEQVTVHDLPAGEAVIEMVVQGGPTFKTGPATRNPDGKPHATVDFYDGTDPEFSISFEEQLAPAPADYDDQGIAAWGPLTNVPPVVETVSVSPRTVQQPGGKVTLAVELAEGTSAGSVVASFRTGGSETNVPLTPAQGDPDAFTGTHTLPPNTTEGDFTIDVVFLVTVGNGEPLTVDGGSIEQFATAGGRWSLRLGFSRPLNPRKPIQFKPTKQGRSTERQFLISNDGKEVLEARIQLKGTGFTIASFGGDELPTGSTQLSFRIPATGVRVISIRFAPQSKKKQKGAMNVTTSDPKQPQIAYKLVGPVKRGR